MGKLPILQRKNTYFWNRQFDTASENHEYGSLFYFFFFDEKGARIFDIVFHSIL